MRSLFLFVLISSVAAPSFAQLSLPNSSFLLEEGWRSDSGVNQHAIAYGDRRWSYTWSQEFAASAALEEVSVLKNSRRLVVTLCRPSY